MRPLLLLALLAVTASASVSAQEVVRDDALPVLRVESDTLRPEYGRILSDGDLFVSGTLMRTNANTGEPLRYVGVARMTTGGTVRFAEEVASSDAGFAMQQPYLAHGDLVAVPIRPGAPGRSRLAVAMIRANDGRQMAIPRFEIRDGLTLRAIVPESDSTWLAVGTTLRPDSSRGGTLLRFDAEGDPFGETPLSFPSGFSAFARGHVLGDTSFVVTGASPPALSRAPRPVPIVAWAGATDRRFGVAIKALWTLTGEINSHALRDRAGAVWVGGNSGDLFIESAAVARRDVIGRTWSRPLSYSSTDLFTGIRLAALAEVPGGVAVITTAGSTLGFGATAGFRIEALSPEGDTLWEFDHEVSDPGILGPSVLDARRVGDVLRIAYMTNRSLRTETLRVLDIRLP